VHFHNLGTGSPFKVIDRTASVSHISAVPETEGAVVLELRELVHAFSNTTGIPSAPRRVPQRLESVLLNAHFICDAGPEVWIEEASCGLLTQAAKAALRNLPERGFAGPWR
jgi:hypothetical protein